MKVAHLTSVHPRYDTRIFVKMCSSLAKHNIDTHLIVADGLGNEVLNRVNIHDVGKGATSRLNRMYRYSWAVYKKAKLISADIYHFHDPELMPIGIMLKMKGKKVVFDVHEDLPRQILRKSWLPKYFRPVLSKIAHVFEYITAKFVDAVVTVTPTIADRFSFSRVIEVRNYASLDEFNSVEIKPNSKNRITYIGGITKDRGVIPMVKSFAHTEQQFTLAGKFQEKGLQEYVETLDGWDKTEFLGWQSREEVQTLLEETLVGLVVLQPTGDYEDAFPVKLFEYMASGAAVIASDFPLWRNIVEQADCGLCVDPTDPNQVAEAINHLSSNKELALKMGEKGKEAVISQYCWQTEFDKLINLYKEIYKDDI